MFVSQIRRPISPLPEDFFFDKARPTGEYDYALSCLAFVLLHSRIQNYGGICGRCGVCGNIEDAVKDALFLEEQGNNDAPRFFYYYCTDMEGELVDKARAELKNGNLTELPQIEAYIKQETQLANYLVAISLKTNSAYVFAPTSHLGLYHLTIAFFFALYPNLFKDKPLTENERALLQSLTQKSPVRFTYLITKALEPMKNEMLKAQIAKWFAGYRESRVRSAEQDVARCQQFVQDNLSQYGQLMQNLNEAIVRYEGLKKVVSDNTEKEDELTEYLAASPNLHDISYSNGYLTYTATTYLQNFDIMKWRHAVRCNDIYNSYRLADDNPFNNYASRKMLLDALFDSQDPDLMVNMIGTIKIHLGNNSVNVVAGEDIKLDSDCGYITNPHYKYHGCLGSNRDQIVSCLQHGDIISAIECSIAGVGSVNIGETEYTFRRMVQEILTHKGKIIHRRDGTDLTTAEALLWLIKKKEENAA